MSAIDCTENTLTTSANKTLNDLLDALIAEQFDTEAAKQLTGDYLDIPESAIADERLGLLAIQLGGPRWWREFVGSPAMADTVGIHKRAVMEAVTSITDAANVARDEASLIKLLSKLKKLVAEERENVEADFYACEHLLPEAVSRAKHGDPVIHFQRFTVDLLQDLHKAEELCETVSSASLEAGVEACSALTTHHLKDLVTGSRIVSALSNGLNAEFNS